VITHIEMWRKLSNKKYRTAFARAQFKRLVPLQIQTLRRQRVLSQEGLAERAGLTQGVISRAEDQDYGNLTVNTILSIAEGLDVAFVGRFVPFSELDKWYVNLSQETMRVPSFDEENASANNAENAIADDERTIPEGAFIVDKRFSNLVDIGEIRIGMEMAGKGQLSLPSLLHATQPRGGSNAAGVCNSR
jgi:transcriptional regulator with XRE-family HTH domain